LTKSRGWVEGEGGIQSSETTLRSRARVQAAAAPAFHEALHIGFSFDQSESGGSVDAEAGWSVTRMGGGGSDDDYMAAQTRTKMQRRG
jgi:hypothetical protein